MFQEEYRNAYEKILPGSHCLEEILEQAAAGRSEKMVGTGWGRGLRPAVVLMLALCLGLKMGFPVVAQQLPGVYRIMSEYVPGLVDFVLPQEISSTAKGITLQVEAVELADNTAEVLLSFRDAEGSKSNQIQGRVDLYDSFYLENYGEDWVAGGISYLEYDEAEDKAYFKVELQSSNEYSHSRVRIGVGQILTRLVREERRLDMSSLIVLPKEKRVTISGGSGMRVQKENAVERNEADPRPGATVLDIVALEEDMLTDLQVTGIAYTEGTLRVQSCRGSFSEVDRHLRPYLRAAEGNERACDYSVSWQEEYNGERVLFDEHCFLISKEELAECELYAMFYITDGSVKGKWSVIFDVE